MVSGEIFKRSAMALEEKPRRISRAISSSRSDSTALPKWLSDMLHLDSARAAELGLIVGATMLMGSAGQLIGGRLADRMPMKTLYVATFLVKLPLMLLAAWFGGVFAAAWLAGSFWWLFVSMHDVGGLPAPFWA